MNVAAVQALRSKLSADQPTFGLWVTLEAASVSEIAVAAGLDWIVIDAEHGHLDWRDIVAHLRTTVRSSTVALVRIEELNRGLIKRVLDIGADGVVVPFMESADNLRDAVRYSTYPPQGVRGMGAERATAWGRAFVEHVSQANEHVLVVPIIETVRGAQQATALAQVDGVELFFFGPADFSASAGYAGQWEVPGVAQQILSTLQLLRGAGKQCGVVATSPENVCERREQGFRMIALGVDTGLMLRGLQQSLAAAGRELQLRADLTST